MKKITNSTAYDSGWGGTAMPVVQAKDFEVCHGEWRRERDSVQFFTFRFSFGRSGGYSSVDHITVQVFGERNGHVDEASPFTQINRLLGRLRTYAEGSKDAELATADLRELGVRLAVEWSGGSSFCGALAEEAYAEGVLHGHDEARHQMRRALGIDDS